MTTKKRPEQFHNEATEAAVLNLQELTKEANALRVRAGEVASLRQNSVNVLRQNGWSFRMIGDTIGVTGQRIDSISKFGT